MAAKSSKGKGKGKSSTTECWFVMLVGLPGSGKSTFGKVLEPRGWVRASQDELGSQDEVRKLIDKSLRHRRSVVLDRCCVHAKERRMWLQQLVRDVPPPLHVECVFFNTPVDQCKARVLARTGHPNLQGAGSETVIDEFARSLEPPVTREGFTAVHTVTTPAEAAALLRTFVALPICAKGV